MLLPGDEGLEALELPDTSNDSEWPDDTSTDTIPDSILALIDDLPDFELDERLAIEESAKMVRSASVDRAIDVLRSDAERGDGELLRTDLERQCFRRQLGIAECIEVERCLVSHGIKIVDNEDGNSVETDPAREALATGFLNNSAYLSESEEKELGRKIQLALRAVGPLPVDDPEYISRLQKEASSAKIRFVVSNLRYVKKTTAHFAYTQHLNEEDLFQEGILGLLRATESYDPEMGFRFKTYATWWINQRIHRAIADGDRTVRLPVHVVEKIKAIRKASRRLTGPGGDAPGLDVVAEALGMKTERVAELMWTVSASECTEGDAPVGDTSTGDGDATAFSFIADLRSPSAFDTAYNRELKRLIITRLKRREAIVLFLRFGLGASGEHTLEEVGAKFGLTRERVRQIQDKALEKLRPIFQKRVYEKAINHGGVYRTRGE